MCALKTILSVTEKHKGQSYLTHKTQFNDVEIRQRTQISMHMWCVHKFVNTQNNSNVTMAQFNSTAAINKKQPTTVIMSTHYNDNCIHFILHDGVMQGGSVAADQALYCLSL